MVPVATTMQRSKHQQGRVLVVVGLVAKVFVENVREIDVIELQGEHVGQFGERPSVETIEFLLTEFSQKEESVEQRAYALVVMDLTAEISFEGDQQAAGVLQVVFVHVVFQQLNQRFERVGTGMRIEISLAIQRGQLEEGRSDVLEIQLLAVFQD